MVETLNLDGDKDCSRDTDSYVGTQKTIEGKGQTSDDTCPVDTLPSEGWDNDHRKYRQTRVPRDVKKEHETTRTSGELRRPTTSV